MLQLAADATLAPAMSALVDCAYLVGATLRDWLPRRSPAGSPGFVPAGSLHLDLGRPKVGSREPNKNALGLDLGLAVAGDSLVDGKQGVSPILISRDIMTDTGDDEHAYDHQATAYASPPLSPLSFDGKFGFGMSASPPVARAVSPLGPLAGVGGLVGFEAKAPDVRRGSRTIPLPEIDDECGSTPTSKSPGWTTMTLPEVGDGELKFDYTFVQVATAYEGVGGSNEMVQLHGVSREEGAREWALEEGEEGKRMENMGSKLGWSWESADTELSGDEDEVEAMLRESEKAWL